MELTDEIKKLYTHHDVPQEQKVATVPIILVTMLLTVLVGNVVVKGFQKFKTVAVPTPTNTHTTYPTLTVTPQPSPTTPTPTRKPMPLPTVAPLPTLPALILTNPTTVPLPTSRPTLNCAGTARDENSQVYISPRTVPIGSTSTVSIELRDCNNNLVSEDWMSADLVSNSPTTKINGLPFPQRIQARSGRVTFTVTSQTAGTVTIRLTNINQNYFVTEPGYRTPYINFTGTTNPTPTNTTIPTAASSPSPSLTPSQTILPTPT